jgi:hypothetical protein
VAEYRGDCVSTVVADLREKRYIETGKDCYFFKVGGRRK